MVSGLATVSEIVQMSRQKKKKNILLPLTTTRKCPGILLKLSDGFTLAIVAMLSRAAVSGLANASTDVLMSEISRFIATSTTENVPKSC